MIPSKKALFDCLDAHFKAMKMPQLAASYLEFKERVKIALNWWNAHIAVVPFAEGKSKWFVGDRAVINDIPAVCSHAEISGAPHFVCEFKFIPYEPVHDLGAGAGMTNTIKF